MVSETSDTAINPEALLSVVRHWMFMRAERWWWSALASVSVGIFAAVLVVANVAPEHSFSATIATAISIAAPAVASLARWRSGECAGRGDICRRALLLHHSLGFPMDVAVSRRVALWPRRDLSAVTTTPYFESRQPVGPARLVDDISESAFYTSELAAIAARIGFTVVAIGAGLPLLACIVSPEIRDFAARQFTAVLGALAILSFGIVIAEILFHSANYYSLATDCTNIFRQAAVLARNGAVSVEDGLKLAEDYSVALARNLPIVNWLYEKNRSRIERAYRQGARSS